MADASHRRRWYQFRLRTLMLVVTAAALLTFAYRTYVEPFTQQRQTQKLIERLGGTYQSSDPTPWQRRLFGDDHQNLVVVNLADYGNPSGYLPYIARLPCLETLVVGGMAFSDEHLRRLSGLTSLRALVLDSTSVSEEALEAWRRRLPGVDVYRSQRRTIAQMHLAGWNLGTEKPRHVPLEQTIGAEYFQEVALATNSVRANGALVLIQGLSSLRTLSLCGSTINDAGLSHLGDLSNLDYLDLTDTQITNAGLAELEHWPNLVYLDLAGTQVTDVGLEHLIALPKLGWLNLNRTQISDAGLPTLARLKCLRMMYVQNTRVSRAAARELDRALSPCLVLGP